MNIWDLKRVNQIFQNNKRKHQSSTPQTHKGFSYFSRNNGSILVENISSSFGNHMNKKRQNEEGIEFEGEEKEKGKEELKYSGKPEQHEDEQWIEKSEAICLKVRKLNRMKNLKTIANTVYKHLRKHTFASYSQLSQELYSDCNDDDDKQQSKNIRRRLYDAVNVMISANVLSKEKNIIQFNDQSTKTTLDLAREEKHMIKTKTEEIKCQISWKKKYLKYLQVIYGILEKFYKRNNGKNSKERMSLPLVTLINQGVEIQVVDGKRVRVINRGNILNPETEMQALARLFPEKQSEFLLQNLTKIEN